MDIAVGNSIVTAGTILAGGSPIARPRFWIIEPTKSSNSMFGKDVGFIGMSANYTKTVTIYVLKNVP